MRAFEKRWKGAPDLTTKRPNKILLGALQTAFASVVADDDDDAWERLQAAMSVALEQDGGPGDDLLSWLLAYKSEDTAEPEVSAIAPVPLRPPPPPVAPVLAADVQRYDAPPDVTAQHKAFAAVWKAWPRGDHHESKTTAATAFAEACQAEGAVDVVAACEHYIADFASETGGHIHPFHLANFLRDHDRLSSWVHRATYKPDPDAAAAFEPVWAWYPPCPAKARAGAKADGFAYWQRHVVPKPETGRTLREQRFYFLCSVRAYRKERRDATHGKPEDRQFTRGLVAHVGCWTDRNTLDARKGEAAVLLEYATVTWFADHGLDQTAWFHDLSDSRPFTDRTKLRDLYRDLLRRHDPVAAATAVVAMAPAAAEGRTVPPTFAEPAVQLTAGTAIFEAAEALAAGPPTLALRWNNGRPLAQLSPQDPAFVAGLREAARVAAAAEQADKLLRFKALVQDSEFYRRRFLAPRLIPETRAALDALPPPWRALAWWAMDTRDGEARAATQALRPRAALTLLIELADKDAPPQGYDYLAYAAALGQALEGLPLDSTLDPDPAIAAASAAVLADPNAPRINPVTGLPVIDFGSMFAPPKE